MFDQYSLLSKYPFDFSFIYSPFFCTKPGAIRFVPYFAENSIVKTDGVISNTTPSPNFGCSTTSPALILSLARLGAIRRLFKV
ncbi:hypothetical protein EVA_11139 [gut metagenome]|uniref:Uncharacterized protein n=1 Tax=gut metagenome TaxID=749906 RepID=J9CL08_9ZZZZ